MPINAVSIAAELIGAWRRELGLELSEAARQRMAQDISLAIMRAVEAGEHAAREAFYSSNG